MADPLKKSKDLAAQGKEREAAAEAVRVGRQALEDLGKALKVDDR